MKKIIAWWLALCLCLCGGCGKTQSLYEVSAQLVELLWEVDYTNFSEKPMTAFAKKHYEAEYLAYYLEDPEYNAGVEHARETQLVSSLISVEDGGCEAQTLDGVDYLVQQVAVQVQVERFAPPYPEKNYFEAGGTYDLIYSIYFIEQGGGYKISGFSYLPADGEMLPAEHRQTLTQAQQDAMLELANRYLAVRYELQGETFRGEEAWAFYEAHVDADFLERDGISAASLAALQQTYAQNGIHIRLMHKQLETDDRKTQMYDGYEADYAYWVHAEYTYRITASTDYLQQNGLAETQQLSELLYFQLDAEGAPYMVFAEYLQD